MGYIAYRLVFDTTGMENTYTQKVNLIFGYFMKETVSRLLFCKLEGKL